MPSARASGRSAFARALVLGALSVVCVVLVRRAMLAGDGAEYYSMLESFWNHGTPDQRVEDVASLRRVLAPHGVSLPDPHGGLFATLDGRWYSYHFWIYPLFAVPAKAVLRALGADEFYALAWTNAALLVGTVAWALRGRKPIDGSRWLLLAFALLGPVIWYVPWSHGEVFTWACVVMSLVAFDERRHPRAAFFAALGALHAPPIMMLAGLCVVFACMGGRRRGLLAIVASSLAGLSPLFYFLEFGTPNLIVATGSADPRLASVGRVVSLAFDLNQGMLPFVPATLLLGLLGLARAVVKRQWRALAVALTALAMMIAASQTTNFNAGCAGMNRYDVWIMPLFAWLAAHHLPLARGTRRARWRWRLVLVSGLALQLALVRSGSSVDDAGRHNALARYVLTRAPSLYSPEPEIFAERTLGTSFDPPWRYLPAPIAFFGESGSATKVLVDRASINLLPERFEVDDGWLGRARRQHAGEHGLFFLEPPPNAVRRLRDPGAKVVFTEGWFDVESLGTEQWRWMSRKATLAVEALESARQVVRLVGWVPEDLGESPTLTVSLDGVLLESFTAPRRRFTRAFAIPAALGIAARRLTIETTKVVQPPRDERTLGFALLNAEVKRAEPAPAPSFVHFVGDAWGEPYGEAGDEGHCALGPAELAVDACPSATTGELVLALSVGAGSPETARARVAIDGHTVFHGLVYRRALPKFRVSATTRHRVQIALDEPPRPKPVSLCVDFARYERSTPPGP
jgi:hypothetical protein